MHGTPSRGSTRTSRSTRTRSVTRSAAWASAIENRPSTLHAARRRRSSRRCRTSRRRWWRRRRGVHRARPGLRHDHAARCRHRCRRNSRLGGFCFWSSSHRSRSLRRSSFWCRRSGSSWSLDSRRRRSNYGSCRRRDHRPGSGSRHSRGRCGNNRRLRHSGSLHSHRGSGCGSGHSWPRFLRRRCTCRRPGHNRAGRRLGGNRRGRGRYAHNGCGLARLGHNSPRSRLHFRNRRCHRRPRRGRRRGHCRSRCLRGRRRRLRRLHWRRGTRRSRCSRGRFLLPLLNCTQYVARLRHLRPINLWLDLCLVPLRR
jgi:hypothetical protein